MKRLSWYIKSFAWLVASTGALVAWCVFVTADYLEHERIAEILLGVCMLGFVGLLVWSLV